jgi:hypothetical protein
MIKFKIQITKKYNMLKRIGLFATLALLIASCSNDEETLEKREIEDYVSAVMNGNEGVFAFGSVSLKKIMDKTDYPILCFLPFRSSPFSLFTSPLSLMSNLFLPLVRLR